MGKSRHAIEDGIAEFFAIAVAALPAGRSVAFDAEEIARGFVGIENGEVDAIAGAADAAM